LFHEFADAGHIFLNPDVVFGRYFNSSASSTPEASQLLSVVVKADAFKSLFLKLAGPREF
jgi:hypothetical protein